MAALDSRSRVRQKNPAVMFEIAARFFESLAMTRRWALYHCEERSDEAISRFATGPFAGKTDDIAFDGQGAHGYNVRRIGRFECVDWDWWAAPTLRMEYIC